VFLRPPRDKGIEFVDGLNVWDNTYQCFYENRLHAIVVKVGYVYPSCEMISIDFLPEEGFEDLRIAEYAKQAICQQALNDFMTFAERTAAALRRTAKLADPFFEES
jgi:hypothetical protein